VIARKSAKLANESVWAARGRGRLKLFAIGGQWAELNRYALLTGWPISVTTKLSATTG
jgi:hypothetical protein